MTMTENPPSRTNGRSASDEAALADQVVLTGAGLASQGIGRLRRAADGTIATVDAIVNGGFDLADQLVRSNLVTELAKSGLGAARRSWAIAVESTRALVVDL